jgi:hypothetical protein
MATIYNKTATDTCIILEPREVLYYPFNVGSYQTIRAGLYLSATSTSGSNTIYPYPYYENIDSNSLFGNVFIGFAKSGIGMNYGLPGQTGLVYCGLKNNGYAQSYIGKNVANPSDNNKISFDGNLDNYNIGYNLTHYLSSGQSTMLNSTFSNNTTGTQIYLANDPSLTTGYVGYYGLEFNLISNQFQLSISNDSNFTTNTNITGLRSKLATFPNRQLIGSGYFTSGFNNSSNLIDRPDSLLLYFPFYLNRIRVHEIMIERYQ